ncbi:hypothetical protein [Seonamhaeicola aphaedonensis]|uniref:Uncharacterized protein n=1 Tax=Seonamhaeicola aphaedonensis TaxID=1461338 RepID=A0A3D9HGV8_9FLAO|nr:hypothetical protein [Seonamhaeicola aphaedonensis]RED48684.1 hypothetical protein DFQ02_10314 [Seonamhaeicola aphaedonensis]
MDLKQVGRYIVLGVLFFLPVTFLLLLYPATHNYTPLDIVNEKVLELSAFSADSEEPIQLKEHITVLGFFGNNPMDKSTAASNLKELVYDKFKGFKKFQVVIVLPTGAENIAKELKREISHYEDLKFWHFVFGYPDDILKIYRSLESTIPLENELATDYVYIIDKELNQRGRLDDREDREIEKDKPVYGLNGYNCVEVAIIKNKMSEDMRILFTEYRQKRKGEFNSDIRRANDLKSKEQ